MKEVRELWASSSLPGDCRGEQSEAVRQRVVAKTFLGRESFSRKWEGTQTVVISAQKSLEMVIEGK